MHDGDYELHIIADMNGDGSVDTSDLGIIHTFTKGGSTAVTETVNSTNMVNLVEETVTITGTGLPGGEQMHVFWYVSPSTPDVNDATVYWRLDYLGGDTSAYGPSGSFRSWNSGTFETDGTVTATSNIPLIPGTYTAAVYVDVDGSDSVNTGDYLFNVENVTIEGTGTDFSVEFAAADDLL